MRNGASTPIYLPGLCRNAFAGGPAGKTGANRTDQGGTGKLDPRGGSRRTPRGTEREVCVVKVAEKQTLKGMVESRGWKVLEIKVAKPDSYQTCVLCRETVYPTKDKKTTVLVRGKYGPVRFGVCESCEEARL